jgi:hypothetical protein
MVRIATIILTYTVLTILTGFNKFCFKEKDYSWAPVFEATDCRVVDPDPHHFGKLDPHPDPHPHQIKIRIRMK